MYLQLRGWFDADFVTSPTPPASVGTAAGTSVVAGVGASDLPSTGISAGAGDASGVGAADSSAAGSSAGVGAASGVSSVGSVGTASGASTVNGVGAVAPPYRVKVRNVTNSGTVGTVQIVPDPANLPQEFLDVNFPLPNINNGGVGMGVNALNYSGNDLGAKINNAIADGKYDIFTPNSAGLVISTPIRIRHSNTIRFSERYPENILCKTGNKPVFEASDPNVRNFNIDGGFFQGSPTQTPSCLLQVTSNSQGTQQSSGRPLSNLETQGSFGVGVVVHIAAEVCTYENCKLNQTDKGDSPWPGHQATVTIGNADYWGVPFAYAQPNQFQQSTSAIVFENCQLGADMANSNQSMMYMKGQVEDVQVNGVYMNAIGRCHFLFEPGFTAGAGWTNPRRIKICGGGRTETNKGVAWAGIPVVIVDGLNQGRGVHMLTMADLGIFIGGGMSHTTPMIRCINGGTIDGFHMPQGMYIEPMTNKLIDNVVSDMNDVRIEMAQNMDITCTGRNFNNCYIGTRGNVFGNVAASSRVRAANFNNW